MMSNELSRMVKRWLVESPFKLETTVASLQIYEGDRRPMVPAIYSDAEDACIAKEIDPTRTPALAIISDGASLAPLKRIQQQYEAKRVPLAIFYAARDVTTIEERQDAGYVLNAVVDSLWALQETGKAGSYKVFNDCELIAWDEVAVIRGSGQPSRVNLIAAVLATAHMRRVPRP